MTDKLTYPSVWSSMTGSADVSSEQVAAFAEWLAKRKPASPSKAKTAEEDET